MPWLCAGYGSPTLSLGRKVLAAIVAFVRRYRRRLRSVTDTLSASRTLEKKLCINRNR